jgi:hypothetical protein
VFAEWVWLQQCSKSLVARVLMLACNGEQRHCVWMP